MLEAGYRNWLTAQGKEPGTVSTSVSPLRRIESAHGNLEQDFRLS